MFRRFDSFVSYFLFPVYLRVSFCSLCLILKGDLLESTSVGDMAHKPAYFVPGNYQCVCFWICCQTPRHLNASDFLHSD